MDMSLQNKLKQKKKQQLEQVIANQGTLIELNNRYKEKAKLKETYQATYEAYDKILSETHTLIAICDQNITLWESHRTIVNDQHQCPLCQQSIEDTTISDQISKHLRNAQKEKSTLVSSKSVTQVYLNDIINKTSKIDQELKEINSARDQIILLQSEIETLTEKQGSD